MPWAGLNQRQRQYLQTIYETDQEQEADERGMWKRGGTPRPARAWRWMEYGVFDGVGSTLYTKLYLRELIDEGTGSTFNALEKRGFILCKYTMARRDSQRHILEPFLMVQITTQGRRLVRAATGAQAYRHGSPGVLKEWHWKAMVEAWKSRPQGVKNENGYYGHIGWNTWLYLRDYKVQGDNKPLIEEYSTWGDYLAHVGYTPQIHWLRLTPFGEQYCRENWQRYCELYPEVDAPALDASSEK
jgi:hypothetical protein